MTCAKVVVTATLLTLDGEEFVGSNDCDNPQTTCPRLPGEGYDKCVEVCRQKGHAEIRAIDACIAAGSSPAGGSMRIRHTHVCKSCASEMEAQGIRYICEQG